MTEDDELEPWLRELRDAAAVLCQSLLSNMYAADCIPVQSDDGGGAVRYVKVGVPVAFFEEFRSLYLIVAAKSR